METRDNVLKSTAHRDAYQRFVNILEEDGDKVLEAYVTIFKSDRPLPEDMKVSKEELIAIADMARQDFASR